MAAKVKNASSKIDNIPIIFKFEIETFVPVINATNRHPIKLNKEHLLFFNKIRNPVEISVFAGLSTS